MTYFTIDQIKRANKERGQYFFSPDTMRFFRSRVLQGVYGGKYFVTSERYSDDTPRRYTVRVANSDGTVESASEFMEFSYPYQARNYAKKLAKEDAE